MTARAMLCQSRTLFRRTRLQLKLRRLHVRRKRLVLRNPSKITGKAIFVKHLLQLLETKKRAGLRVRPGFTQRIIKTHGAQWSALDSDAKSVYLATAVQHRQDGHVKLLEQVEMVDDDIRTTMGQIAAEHSTDVPLKLSKCALSESELLQFGLMWDDPELVLAEQGAGFAGSGQHPCRPSTCMGDGFARCDACGC